jgi:uroporphyrinogen decarboxylase
MPFEPDYQHFLAVMHNRRPARLPLYEHHLSVRKMEEILNTDFAPLEQGTPADRTEFFHQYCRFFREMTYDTVSYEVCISSTLPGNLAITGGEGPIQSRADFESYPWQDLPRLYWDMARPRFDALVATLPAGMKAVGGVGNGVFELAESLVGMEFLPYMQADDPELYADLYLAIGNLMHTIWVEFLARYNRDFAACRFGDDLGFRTSLLTNPATIREHIIPQYRRIINLVHASGSLFLLHSCGCIFEIMEDMIAAGIDAKHSNEDAIAPFDRWITDYGTRIGLLGGFDMDFLCSQTPDVIRNVVQDQGRQHRKRACGYALGSGNSIPDYVPTENYLAMIEATRSLRMEESA